MSSLACIRMFRISSNLQHYQYLKTKYLLYTGWFCCTIIKSFNLQQPLSSEPSVQFHIPSQVHSAATHASPLLHLNSPDLHTNVALRAEKYIHVQQVKHYFNLYLIQLAGCNVKLACLPLCRSIIVTVRKMITCTQI